MKTRSPRRRGLSLTEMCAVMFLFGVLLALGGAVLAVDFKSQRMANATQSRLDSRQTFAAEFRRDVQHANVILPEFRTWKTGPTCVILRTPTENHVIYHWAKPQLDRIEVSSDGQETRRVALPIGSVSEVEFRTPAANGPRVIALSLRDDVRNGPTKQTEILAALGGNSK